MIDLSDLIRPEAVTEGVTVASKKALLQQLAGAAASVYGVGVKETADALSAREKLGSTGFGGGIAIPHARLPGLTSIVGVFMLLTKPIDFAAVDEMPVDLVFALFSPVDAGSDHLKALARVSRRLREPGFIAKLRGAGSRDAIYVLLMQDEARDAA